MQFLVEISGVKARTSAIRFPLAVIVPKMPLKNTVMKIFVLIFTLSFALISAQTHRFIYEFKYKQNPKQTEFQKIFNARAFSPAF